MGSAIQSEPAESYTWEEAVKAIILSADPDNTRNVTCEVSCGNGISKKFVVSRYLMKLASPVFEEILNDETTKYFRIQNVDVELFEIILWYFYRPYDWSTNGSILKMFNLLEVVQKLRMDDLEEIILQQVPELRGKDELFSALCNFLNSKIYEESLQGMKVLRDARSLISSLAPTFVTHKAFESLTPESLENLLKNQTLAKLSELELFIALVKWGIAECQRNLKSCNGGNLSAVLKEFHKCVNFTKMSSFDFTNYVLFTEVWTSNKKELDFLKSCHREVENKSVSKEKQLQAELFQTQFKSTIETWELKMELGKIKEREASLQETLVAVSEELQKTKKMNENMRRGIELGSYSLATFAEQDLKDALVGSFSCFIKISNHLPQSLMWPNSKCYGTTKKCHQPPSVINPFTMEVFSFDTGPAVRGAKNRVHAGFVYAFKPEKGPARHFVVRFCVRANYGEVGLAFLPYSGIKVKQAIDDMKEAPSYFNVCQWERGHQVGELLSLSVQQDSFQVDVTMTINKTANLSVQVWEV